MADIDLSMPATIWSRIELASGRPREQRVLAGDTTLKDCVLFARSGSAGDIERLVIKLGDAGEVAGWNIQRLIDQL